MDNFTHSLTGWALGQTGLKRRSRKGLAALILGANMPDIDVFFGWVSWEPLAMHRGFTHGLVGGVLLMPPLLASLLWLLDRWQLRRGARFRSGLEMHFGWLLALSYAGAVTHPLLDWQNSYAVQLLSPFSSLWFHNDTLFIIDVWIWSGLSFAIWLSRRWEKRGDGRWRVPPIVALVLLVAYVCSNAVITGAAKSALAEEHPERIFATPQPALFWRRDLVWRKDGTVTWGTYDPIRGLHSVSDPVPDNLSDPLVRRAMTANAEINEFLRWSTMTIATAERERCRAVVRFSDARFAGRAAGSFTRQVELPIAGTGCPSAASD